MGQVNLVLYERKNFMERVIGNVDLEGIKYFQVPDAIIKIKCPKCGDVAKIKLIDQIYYPADPSDPPGHEVSFECEKCDIVIARRIHIVSVIVTFNVEDEKIV